MSFRQCVFQDGYVYFTDNGDTSIKGTPRFRLGSSGLQIADGENIAKEQKVEITNVIYVSYVSGAGLSQISTIYFTKHRSESAKIVWNLSV